MSNRESRTFREAICANPDDDTTRLVFADWLEERGDAARAEFIRTQVERATLPDWDARRVRLLMRERALLAQYESEWRAQLPVIKGVIWGEFRRGFIATARFDSFGVFKTDGSECWAAAPIEAVEVRWPRTRDIAAVPGLRELSVTGRLVAPDDLTRLIEAPVLSTLRSLTIRGAALGPDGFHRLLTSPHLRNLTALRVPHNSLGNRAIDALGRGTLPSLTELDLSELGGYGRYAEDPILNAGGMATMAGWPGLSQLRSLSLSGNDLQQAGLRELLQSQYSVGLKHLTIRDNALTGDAMREFVTAKPGLQLDSLNLGENVLQGPGAGHLAKADCLRELRTLHLDRCELGFVAVRKLTKAPFLGNLRILKADNNNFGPKGLAALLAANPADLHTLDVAGNNLGDAAVVELAKSSASNTLVDVNLGWNRLSDKTTQALAASDHLQNLLILRLTHNHQISEKAATALAQSPLGKRLAVLEWLLGMNDPIPF